MYVKSQPCKMSCHIPCDFGKCHEVSSISRVLPASNKSPSWRGKQILTIAAEPRVTEHETAGTAAEAEVPKLHSRSQCLCVRPRTDPVTKSLLHSRNSCHPPGNLEPLPVDAGITVTNSWSLGRKVSEFDDWGTTWQSSPSDKCFCFLFLKGSGFLSF